MMTLEQLAKRLNDILFEMPGKASQPVYVRRQKSRRTTEYIPIRFGCSGTLSVGDIHMTELTADNDNILVFDSSKGVRPRKG